MHDFALHVENHEIQIKISKASSFQRPLARKTISLVFGPTDLMQTSPTGLAALRESARRAWATHRGSSVLKLDRSAPVFSQGGESGEGGGTVFMAGARVLEVLVNIGPTCFCSFLRCWDEYTSPCVSVSFSLFRTLDWF